MKKISKVDTCMSLCNAKATISKIGDKFDSHEFIRIYSDTFPTPYKDLISHYKMVGSAHALIGSYLSNYRNELGIESCGRISSLNVHGDKTECELWRKTKI